MKGYIHIHREIENHWLWLQPRRFQWWLQLLFMASYVDKTIAFGNDIIHLQRGQLATTIRQLMRRWGAHSQAALAFLTVLENENMIVRESNRKMTIITIINYDKYQSESSFKNDNSKRKSKHIKEEIIEEKEKIIIPTSPSREMVLDFFNQLMESEISLEEIAKCLKLDVAEIKTMAEEFRDECLIKEKYHPNFKDYKEHFYNWARKVITLPGPKPTNKTNNNGNKDRYEARRASGVTSKSADDIRSSFSNRKTKK